MMAASPELIVAIEKMSFRALPALEQRLYDGWLLRFAAGYTGRANSVNPIYGADTVAGVREKIRMCEELYNAQGLPTMFKLTAAAQPPGLDGVLRDAGYALRENGDTSVYTTELAGGAARHQAGADIMTEIEARPSDAWFAAFTGMNRVAGDHHQTLRRILNLISVPCAYISLRHEGDIAGVGLAVHDDEWIGIYDMFVSPSMRRRGFARLMMRELMAWGAESGARCAYLQVVKTNVPARTLYESLGFAYAYDYWYRVKPLDA